MNIRNGLLGACAVSGACLLGAVVPQQASTGGHLFVANLGAFPSAGKIARFRLIDGKPAKNPDLIFSKSAAPFAVAADGTVYAQDDAAFSIDVYPPGSTTPERQLALNPCGPSYIYSGVTALAVDAAGYLYVDVSGGVSGIGPDDAGCSGETVVIYPPGAGGNTPPVQFIGFSQYASDPTFGVATSATGALAITHFSANQVLAYAHPLAHHERLTQLFWRDMNGPEGIAYDSAQHEIFVSNYYGGSLAAYSARAQGGVRPKRIIRNAGTHAYCGSIALSALDVFVSDSATNIVYEYDKAARGSPPPVATLSIPFTPCGVAVGP